MIDQGGLRVDRRLALAPLEAIRVDALGDEVERVVLVKGPPLPPLSIMLDAEAVAHGRGADVEDELFVGLLRVVVGP